jgi:hypothetical protein
VSFFTSFPPCPEDVNVSGDGEDLRTGSTPLYSNSQRRQSMARTRVHAARSRLLHTLDLASHRAYILEGFAVKSCHSRVLCNLATCIRQIAAAAASIHGHGSIEENRPTPCDVEKRTTRTRCHQGLGLPGRARQTGHDRTGHWTAPNNAARQRRPDKTLLVYLFDASLS